MHDTNFLYAQCNNILFDAQFRHSIYICIHMVKHDIVYFIIDLMNTCTEMYDVSPFLEYICIFLFPLFTYILIINLDYFISNLINLIRNELLP